MDQPTLPASTAAPPPSPPLITTTSTTSTPKPEPRPAPQPEPDNGEDDPKSQERGRIQAILTAPKAVDREGLAHVLAFESDHDPATARKILAAAPMPAAPVANGFAAAMSRVPNPVVGTGTGAEDDSPAAEAARVLMHVAKERRIS